MTTTEERVPVTTACTERLALRPGVYRADLDAGGTRLLAWPHAQSVGTLDPGLQAVLAALAGPARERADLVGIGTSFATPAADVGDLLDRLDAGGWLATTVAAGGNDLYTLCPRRAPEPPTGEPGGAVRLSRFAVVRRDGDDTVVESPLSWCDLRVHHPPVLAALAGDRALPDGVLTRLRADLHRGRFAPGTGEEDELRTRQWSPHELWFHDRSRLHDRGYLGSGFGGTFWAKDVFPPLPARPPVYSGDPVALHRPDLARLRTTDPGLTAVLEDRRSVRVHDDAVPITVAQLGEFLFRVARSRSVHEADGVEYASRPYPSGGSVYELEIYAVVRTAAGLDPGMYHYDSHDHVLRPVCGADDPAVRRLLRVAAHGSATGTPPQVLFTVSARVGRLMWKYEQMAYALVLKHVGVLQQTMYCVATAMGLAACGLGGGDAAAFTLATGRDPLVECSVGEFALGTVPS